MSVDPTFGLRTILLNKLAESERLMYLADDNFDMEERSYYLGVSSTLEEILKLL